MTPAAPCRISTAETTMSCNTGDGSATVAAISALRDECMRLSRQLSAFCVRICPHAAPRLLTDTNPPSGNSSLAPTVERSSGNGSSDHTRCYASPLFPVWRTYVICVLTGLLIAGVVGSAAVVRQVGVAQSDADRLRQRLIAAESTQSSLQQQVDQ